MGKYKSKEASIDNIKRMFAASPTENAISIGQAFAAWGRPESADPVINKSWISNKLTALRHHNLIEPTYEYSDGRKKLSGIQLTDEGKKALGRATNVHVTEDKAKNENQPLSIHDVMAIVAKLKKDNPAYEINFDVKLKGE